MLRMWLLCKHSQVVRHKTGGCAAVSCNVWGWHITAAALDWLVSIQSVRHMTCRTHTWQGGRMERTHSQDQNRSGDKLQLGVQRSGEPLYGVVEFRATETWGTCNTVNSHQKNTNSSPQEMESTNCSCHLSCRRFVRSHLVSESRDRVCTPTFRAKFVLIQASVWETLTRWCSTT